ncbi:MAG: hypothetical protein ACRDKI_03225 [Solirubrobacterales bacterium]
MNLLLAVDTGGSYVAAAYGVFIAILLIYVGIMATRLSTIQKSLADILRKLDERE